MTGSRTKRIVKGSLAYGAIIAITLVGVDLVCIALNLFPPTHKYGDTELGWLPAPATGAPAPGSCTEYSTGETIRFHRNEDGIRTRLRRGEAREPGQVRIAVTGDSQTDLCAPDDQTHPGVLESSLTSQGIPTAVLAYGAGRYSPLQDYLAFRQTLLAYHPDVLVINVYTGNDFYDILRSDDRPHLVRAGDGYRVAPPVWFQLDDPAVRRWSRVAFLFRSVAEKLGLRSFGVRFRQLRQTASGQGGNPGLGSILGYMKDLWEANAPKLGYPAAFSAQILNQQLFFHHFPEGEAESLRRMSALLALIRQENPELLLVMSPLPSYQLIEPVPVDSALLRVLERLPISYREGVAQERALYEQLRGIAGREGWLFVDNLAALKSHEGTDRLYNGFDYHLLPEGSAIVGRQQAEVIGKTIVGLRTGRRPG